MTRPNLNDGGCEGKTAYTPAEAHRQLRLRQKRNKWRKDSRGSMHAYRCPHCGRWHVGTRSFV